MGDFTQNTQNTHTQNTQKLIDVTLRTKEPAFIILLTSAKWSDKLDISLVVTPGGAEGSE